MGLLGKLQIPASEHLFQLLTAGHPLNGLKLGCVVLWTHRLFVFFNFDCIFEILTITLTFSSHKSTNAINSIVVEIQKLKTLGTRDWSIEQHKNVEVKFFMENLSKLRSKNIFLIL